GGRDADGPRRKRWPSPTTPVIFRLRFAWERSFVIMRRIFAWLFRTHVLQLLRIIYRRGDDIAAAGPLPQINQTAAVTAKRKILVGGQHQRPAGRATERTVFSCRHISNQTELVNG